MTKYTVVHYFIEDGDLVSAQISKWFDSIQDAEASRMVLLNEQYPRLSPQKIRVVQYDFT